MKIGIHHDLGSYSEHWIRYCQESHIPYKIVNSYANDIIQQLEDCNIFMWHISHSNPRDALFAKELMHSLEATGKIVYPNSRSSWHFDDKLGQKYLLESIGIPLVPTFVFYSKKEALNWISTADFPLVFKLRRGAGGRNVRLVKTKTQARFLILRAFYIGIRQYNAFGGIKEIIRRYRMRLTTLTEVIKAFAHLIYPIQLEKSIGRDKGYVYFQKYIPENKTDIRVQFVGDKCWAMVRKIRKNDFRASGSGEIDFNMAENVPKDAIDFAFRVNKSLKMQSLALDLLEFNGSYLITEISYAFGVDPEELEFGHYDGNLNWHQGKIDPFGWMVEDLKRQFLSSSSE